MGSEICHNAKSDIYPNMVQVFHRENLGRLTSIAYPAVEVSELLRIDRKLRKLAIKIGKHFPELLMIRDLSSETPRF
jgi:hypothetical protein